MSPEPTGRHQCSEISTMVVVFAIFSDFWLAIARSNALTWLKRIDRTGRGRLSQAFLF
jgi:hypothetical protein